MNEHNTSNKCKEVTFAVAFTPSKRSDSTNLRHHDTGAATYYNALTGALASAARWGETKLMLITTEPPPETTRRILDSVEIEVAIIPFTHRPPTGFWPKFNASLFALDAINYLCSRGDDRVNMLIDPDCYIINDWAPIAELSRHAFSALRLGVAATWENNGLSAVQASGLHQRLDPSLSGVAPSFGGEWYGFTGEIGRHTLARAQLAYEYSLKRWAQGHTDYFTTEEHLFNFALRGAPVADLDGYVRRIWTTPTYRVVIPTDMRLIGWHLPAEKDRGLWSLRNAIADRSSWFHQGSAKEFRHRLGRGVGIPRRPPLRYAYDNAAFAFRWLQDGGHDRRGKAARATSQ